MLCRALPVLISAILIPLVDAEAQTRPRILLTAFLPDVSNGVVQPYNTSRVIVEAYLSRYLSKARSEIRYLALPVSYREAPELLLRAIDDFSPQAVVVFGQHSFPNLALERFAFNEVTSKRQDATGFRPLDGDILRDGQAQYMSTLPLSEIEDSLRGVKNLRSYVSESEHHDFYVCNFVYYRLMDHLAKSGRSDVLAGLVHVWNRSYFRADLSRLNSVAVPAVRRVIGAVESELLKRQTRLAAPL